MYYNDQPQIMPWDLSTEPSRRGTMKIMSTNNKLQLEYNEDEMPIKYRIDDDIEAKKI